MNNLQSASTQTAQAHRTRRETTCETAEKGGDGSHSRDGYRTWNAVAMRFASVVFVYAYSFRIVHVCIPGYAMHCTHIYGSTHLCPCWNRCFEYNMTLLSGKRLSACHLARLDTSGASLGRACARSATSSAPPSSAAALSARQRRVFPSWSAWQAGAAGNASYGAGPGAGVAIPRPCGGGSGLANSALAKQL